MYCANCGARMNKDDLFCGECGTPVATDGTVASNIPTQATDYLAVEQPLHYQQYNQQYNQQHQQNYQWQQQPAVPPDQQSYQWQQQPAAPMDQQNNQGQQQPAAPPDQPEYQHKKKLSNTAIILIAAACFVLLGIGIFIFVDPLNYFSNDLPPQSERPSQSDGGQQSSEEHQTGEGQQSHEPEATPTQEPEHPAVEIINITHRGEVVLEIMITEGDEISVRALIEPYIANADIEWTSSDTGVFTVTPFGATGSEAGIEAVSPGLAILTATSGDVIRECVIIVIEDDTQQFNDNTLGDFFRNIDNTNVELRLIVSWVDGPQAGRDSIYFRERNSSVWQIRRVTGVIDEINPSFHYDAVDGPALVILWPAINYARTHYLFEDGTGYFSRDYNNNRSVYENFVWELTIG